MQWNKNIQTGVRTRDQRLPFMFETTGIQTAGAQANRYQPSSEYVLPINPEMYRIAYPTRANATQTIGGAFQDNIGLGLPKISMQGTFGYLGNQVGGHGMTLGSKVKDAWEMFIELEQTFMLFYQRFGTYTLRGEKVDEVFQGKIDPKTRRDSASTTTPTATSSWCSSIASSSSAISSAVSSICTTFR